MQKLSKSLMPLNCRCIKCKWALKTKHNSMYCTRLVACGYSQVAGINISKNFLLVMSNITFRALLLTMIYLGFVAKVVIFKMTFLCEELEEKIYMECHPGMNDVGKDDYIIFGKHINDLVQTVWEYNKKAVEILKKVSFA